MSLNDADHAPYDGRWRIFRNINGRLCIMVRHYNGVAAYAPMYTHILKLLQPHKLTEAEKFNLDYPNPAMLTTIADKLRYYRYQKALKQNDAADYTGIFRSTYTHYENGMGTYPLDKLEKTAELLEVSIYDLLDDYHLFLWTGQGKQLKMLQKERALTQKAVAELMGVNIASVKRWEFEKVTIPKDIWRKLVINPI